MKIDERQVLKHVSIVARAVGLFPILVVLVSLMGWVYDVKVLPFHLFSIIVLSYIGYFQMAIKQWLWAKLEKHKVLAHLIMGVIYLGGIASAGWYIGSMMSQSIPFKAIFAVLTLVLYALAIKAYESHYSEIMTMEVLTLITAIYIVTVFLSKASCWGGLYLFIFVTYIFVGNQIGIDQLVRQAKQEVPMLRSIRQDNMKWVCLMMSVILVLYPLRNIIGKGIKWVLGWICYLFFMLIQGILYLLSLLLTETKRPKTDGSMVQLGLEEGTSGNKLADVIFILIGIGAILYILYSNRKRIINGIRKLKCNILSAIRNLYRTLFTSKRKNKVNHGEYTDIVESIDDSNLIRKEMPSNLNKRKWQKLVKRYLKEMNTNSDYRMGYGLLLQGAYLKGIQVKKSYTPRELVKYIEAQIDLPQLNPVTRTYEYVRYGEKACTLPELQQIGELLQRLLQDSKSGGKWSAAKDK